MLKDPRSNLSYSELVSGQQAWGAFVIEAWWVLVTDSIGGFNRDMNREPGERFRGLPWSRKASWR